MSRAAIWQIWVPRVLVAGVLLLAAQYAAGLAARSYALRASRSALQSDVKIGNAHVSLAGRQVALHNVRIANPRRADEPVLEADSCQLELATGALLHKQIVAKRGRVDGLRFKLFAGDVFNQASSTAQQASLKWNGENSGAAAERWLAHLGERLNQNRCELLESVKRTEAFYESWATQSAALEARGREFSERVANVRQGVEAARANPLRGEKFMAELPNAIAVLKYDFEQLSTDFAKLPEQLDAQRRAIIAARRMDDELAARRLDLDSIDAAALNAYLIRTPATGPINELFAWIRWMREQSPVAAATTPMAPIACRTRGEDVLFAGCYPRPDFVLQSLALRGTVQIANQTAELRGTASGISTQPAMTHEPLRLRIESNGSLPFELQAISDRTRGAKRDNVFMECKGILLPAFPLGNTEQLALTVAPSVASLQASLALDGEQITGSFHLVQQDVQITPAVQGELADLSLSNALQDSLGKLDSLATRITISGTLTEPKCAASSNLGPALSEALRQAMDRAIKEQARSMVREATRHVDERLAAIEREMAEQQSRWRACSSAARDELRVVVASQASSDRLSPARLGHRLPGESLLR